MLNRSAKDVAANPAAQSRLVGACDRDQADTRTQSAAAEQLAADTAALLAAVPQRQEPAFEQAVPAMAAPPAAEEGEALTKPPEFADFPIVDRGPASARQRAIQAEETAATTGAEAAPLTGTGAEAAGQPGRTQMPSSIGGSSVEAARQAAEPHRTAEDAEKLPPPPQTPVQLEPLASVREIQRQAERGSLPAMVALAGMETQLKTVTSGSTAVAPAGGDAAFQGGVTNGAEQQLSSAEDTPNVNPSSQAGAAAVREGGMTAAAPDVGPEASPMPEGWHRQALETLPADMRTRLAQIDADNAARMRATAPMSGAGEAPAAAAAGTPVVEIVDEVFIKVSLVL